MTKEVPFVQITMPFMQTTFKYCAKYTIIQLLEGIELSIMYIQGGICMIGFLVCLALLIGGYFVYDSIVNNIFSQRNTGSQNQRRRRLRGHASVETLPDPAS